MKKSYQTRNLVQTKSFRIHSRNCSPKPLFIERMEKLLSNKKDFNNYLKTINQFQPKSIRCNTIKISSNELAQRFKQKDWKFNQPFSKYPEVFIIKSILEPGELGRSLEHQLGYYYVQEIASMLPIIALNPKSNDLVLDLCSAPGSKTTQAAAKMQNTGTIIANEVSLGRIKILSANLGRCGVMNTIITKRDGIALCKTLKKQNFQFDKILIDAPCSGEGTIRSTPKTCLMWNIKTVKNLSRLQKALVSSAIEILKQNGELVYSTCTHAPEENEEVVDFIIKNFDNMNLAKVELPITTRKGIINWDNKKYNEVVKLSHRIYPQDNNTEGFFIAKLKK